MTDQATSIHLQNQLTVAIDHALAAGPTSPLGITNDVTRAVVATLEAHTTCRHCPTPEAQERARIVWWLRAGAHGPAAPHTDPEYLRAMTEIADVIVDHPDRFADAPTTGARG